MLRVAARRIQIYVHGFIWASVCRLAIIHSGFRINVFCLSDKILAELLRPACSVGGRAGLVYFLFDAALLANWFGARCYQL